MKIEEVSKIENQLVSEAPALYGEYFSHAQIGVDFMDSFIKNLKPEAAFFMVFFSQVKKHIILALLSAVRLHHVQANFDFRYATEAGSWAAFAMAHQKTENFADSRDDEIIEPTEDHKKRMYKWLEENYPIGNESIKRFKGSINKLSKAFFKSSPF